MVGKEENKKRSRSSLEEDTDFIRGKPLKEEPGNKAVKIDDNLFAEKATTGPASKKAKLLKKEYELSKPIEDLSYKKLIPGMLLFGIVTEVGDVDVVLSLPQGLTAFLHGTDVSEEFNQALGADDEAEDDEDNEESDIPSLSDIFTLGQHVSCAVTEILTVNKNKKVKVSSNPQLINKHILSHNVEKNLELVGSVSSEEDHGYIVNIGISGVTAFLHTEQCNDVKLRKGALVNVVVKSVSNNNALLALITEKRKSKVLSEKVITNFSTLLPGHLVNVVVKKQSANGIKCSLIGGVMGTIHIDHLTDLWAEQNIQEVYPIKRKLTARVLVINPGPKHVSLSILPSQVSLERPMFGGLVKGDVVEEATVVRVCKRGVYLDVGGGIHGYCNISKLCDEPSDKIGALYKVNTTHNCRVMGFRVVDNLAQLSLAPRDIEKPFLSYADIQPAISVTAYIISIEEFGLIVKLADNIRGIVPKMHLSDIRVKNPAMKFKPNQKLKAKVLTVDAGKRKLQLTLKRSIVKSDAANVLSFSDLQVGQQIVGWVAAIKECGLIMNFTNGVKGLVHKREVADVPVEYEELLKLYKIGQVLTCRVTRVEPTENKLQLSLNLTESTSNTWARRGQIVQCLVKDNKPDGLSVTLLPGNEEAFLPTGHLSDHPSLFQSLLLGLKPSSQLPKVLILNKKQNKIIVSAKSSLINWTEKFETLPKVNDFSVGDFLPCYIKNFQDYGCFVEAPNGLIGLCPKALLADHFVSNPREAYTINQTVMCKITNIDVEKERFLVSLKMSDITDATLSGPVLMEQYIKEFDVLGGFPEEFPIGSVCEGDVQRVTEQGSVVKVGDYSAFVLPDHTDEPVVVGSMVRGVIIDYDPAKKMFILNVKVEFVLAVEGAKKKKLVEGSQHKGLVLLEKPDYFVVVLKETNYRFGYVYKKCHMNDHNVAYKNMKSGESYDVIIKRAKKGKAVIMDFVVSKANRKRKASELCDIKFNKVEVGGVYTVKVKTVKQLQLNVQFGRKMKGRVHITEITDDPTEGETPLKPYKHGDTLEVKLVGFRHSKTHRYLPITRIDFTQSVGEFSLRPSVKDNEVEVVKEGEKRDESTVFVSSLNVGQEIKGFVRSIDSNGFIWICLTPAVEARLWYGLTSSDKSEIESWQSRFTIGQCLSCTVFSTTNNRVDLSLVGALVPGTKLWGIVREKFPGIGLKLQISGRDYGVVPLTELSDHFVKDPLTKFTEDDMVQCIIVEKVDKRCVLSLRKSRTSQRWKKSVGGSRRKVVDPVISSVEDCTPSTVVNGYVRSTGNTGLFITVGYNVIGRILLKNMSDKFLKNWEPMFPVGKMVKVFVVENKPKLELSMKRSDLQSIDKKEEKSEGTKSAQECLDDILLAQFQDSGSDDLAEEESEEECTKETDAPNIFFSSKKKEETKEISLAVAMEQSKVEVEEESEEEEDPEVPEPEAPRGKSNLKREKKRKRDTDAEETRNIELKLRESDAAPETEDDFERLIAASPNSSAAWVQFMAYWLDAGQPDKARAAARRALDTISYRLEEEKLNIWSALFNLENSFGTYESIMSVCKEAAGVNDAKSVFMRLGSVFDKSAKYKEVDEIYSSVLLKKHKNSRNVWCSYALSLAAQDRMSDVRELLPRALKSLPKHKHIRTISHFAQLEFKHGDGNRGSTMFEDVLSSYPHRLDLWSVYFDKTITRGDDEQTRLLFERVIGLKLPIKKMKFFFKRYLDFESSQKNEKRIENVRRKAKEFLDQSIASES